MKQSPASILKQICKKTKISYNVLKINIYKNVKKSLLGSECAGFWTQQDIVLNDCLDWPVGKQTYKDVSNFLNNIQSGLEKHKNI